MAGFSSKPSNSNAVFHSDAVTSETIPLWSHALQFHHRSISLDLDDIRQSIASLSLQDEVQKPNNAPLSAPTGSQSRGSQRFFPAALPRRRALSLSAPASIGRNPSAGFAHQDLAPINPIQNKGKSLVGAVSRPKTSRDEQVQPFEISKAQASDGRGVFQRHTEAIQDGWNKDLGQTRAYCMDLSTGGTGVFHPRVKHRQASRKKNARQKQNKVQESGRGAKSFSERIVLEGWLEESSGRLPPGIALPSEWPYEIENNRIEVQF